MAAPALADSPEVKNLLKELGLEDVRELLPKGVDPSKLPAPKDFGFSDAGNPARDAAAFLQRMSAASLEERIEILDKSPLPAERKATAHEICLMGYDKALVALPKLIAVLNDADLLAASAPEELLKRSGGNPDPLLTRTLGTWLSFAPDAEKHLETLRRMAQSGSASAKMTLVEHVRTEKAVALMGGKRDICHPDALDAESDVHLQNHGLLEELRIHRGLLQEGGKATVINPKGGAIPVNLNDQLTELTDTAHRLSESPGMGLMFIGTVQNKKGATVTVLASGIETEASQVRLFLNETAVPALGGTLGTNEWKLSWKTSGVGHAIVFSPTEPFGATNSFYLYTKAGGTNTVKINVAPLGSAESKAK